MFMARFRIKKEFRSRLSEKLMDLGNLSFAGLVLGQFVGGQEFDANLFAVGILFAATCYLVSYLLEL